jgi:hypothetical protein
VDLGTDELIDLEDECTIWGEPETRTRRYCAMKQIVVLAVVALLLTACRSVCCPGGIAVSEQDAVAEVEVPVQRESTQPLPGFDRITVGGETIDLPRVRHTIRVER